MNKYLLLLLLICPLSMSYADRDYDKTGIFFCTTDLSPTAYGRLQQTFQTLSKKSLFGATVSSSIGTASIFSGYYKIGFSMITISGIGYISYSYFDNLLKEGKKLLKSSLNPTSSTSGVSSSHMNYVPIKRRTFDEKEGKIVSYKHCSIMVAKYADTGSENTLAVGGAEIKSFVQDAYRSITNVERTGYKAPAAVSSDGLQAGTVCTLVKVFPVQNYRVMMTQMNDFFHDKAETTKYEVISNNCCTVAYDYVVHIDGSTTVIDESNFNHGVGIISRSVPSLAKHVGEYVLSFFVGGEDHLKDLEKKIREESETQGHEEKSSNEL